MSQPNQTVGGANTSTKKLVQLLLGQADLPLLVRGVIVSSNVIHLRDGNDVCRVLRLEEGLGEMYRPANANTRNNANGRNNSNNKGSILHSYGHLQIDSYIVSGANPLAETAFCALVQWKTIFQSHDTPVPVGGATLHPNLLLSASRETRTNDICNTIATTSIPGSKAPTFLTVWAPALSVSGLVGFGAINPPSRLVHTFENATQLEAILGVWRKSQAYSLLGNDVLAGNVLEWEASRQRLYNASGQYTLMSNSVVRAQNHTIQSNMAQKYTRVLNAVTMKASSATASNNGSIFTSLSPSSLNPDMLKEWHAALGPEGMKAPIGQWRTENVRVGRVHFVPASQIPAALETLCRGLQLLQDRLLPNNRILPSIDGLHRLAIFAAAVFFGVGDVHPFVDGNGRVARLAMDWALAQAQWPWPVILYHNKTQRDEYTAAVLATRRNLHLIAHGPVSANAMLEAYEKAGAFGPLVHLILERMHESVRINALAQRPEDGYDLLRARLNPGGINSSTEAVVLDSELRAVDSSTDAAIVRAWRQHTHENDQCMICLDGNPHIVLLCCGKGCHWHCLSQWCQQQGTQNGNQVPNTPATCPQCRTPLPGHVEPRMAPPNELAEQLRAIMVSHMVDMTEETTTVDDEDDNNDNDNDNQSTTMESDASETTITDANQNGASGASNNVIYCRTGHCHNRAAVDCINNCCGRCCHTYGQFFCTRHSN
jgi:fido (protein-threonine AMPylation protein)